MGIDLRFAPALGGALASAAARACFTAHPLAALGIAAVGLSASLALARVLPVLEIGPHPSLAHLNRVGIRHIRGTRERPPLSVFYPTSIAPLHPVSWLPHGDMRYAHGFAQYAKMPTAIFNHLLKVKITATRNAAAVSIQTTTTTTSAGSGSEEGASFRPVIIFSHGLAGHGHIASALCCDLAALGAIVVSMEHRDGSASFARDEHSADDEMSTTPHQHPPSIEDAELLAFREKQLGVRVDELRATTRFVATGELFNAMHVPRGEIEAFLDASTAGTVLRPIVFAGHSFGAATAFATAVQDMAASSWRHGAFKPLTLTHVANFDIWCWPTQSLTRAILQDPRQAAAKMPCPVTFFDSENWERWEENRDYVLELCKEPRLQAQREVVSGTDHYSACDMAILIPKLGRKSYKKADDRKVILNWASKLYEASLRAPSK